MSIIRVKDGVCVLVPIMYNYAVPKSYTSLGVIRLKGEIYEVYAKTEKLFEIMGEWIDTNLASVEEIKIGEPWIPKPIVFPKNKYRDRRMLLPPLPHKDLLNPHICKQ